MIPAIKLRRSSSVTGLSDVRLHFRPNQFLVLPAGFGTETPHETSPVYPFDAGALFDLVRQTVTAEPRVKLRAADEKAYRLELVQRTPLLRFADDITIECVPLEGGAGLAIYSRSRLGFSDLGTNAKRIRHWLSLIEKAVRARRA
jgi:uncharacterized protein (DUF1499 family)